MSHGSATLMHSFDAGVIAPSHTITDVFRSSQIVVEDAADGSKVLKGVRIFKTGELTDSLGRRKNWTSADLVQMAAHYGLLRDSGIFPDVPMRADHTTSVKDLVGYFKEVYVDPSDPNYLSADLQFTEPDAYEKWRRGTYRGRSLEVGMYTTEAGQSYYPAVMGLAFVDIPAVEGLHNKNVSDVVTFTQAVVETRENGMPGQAPDIATDPQGWLKAANYAKACEDWIAGANYAQACEDWINAANYAKAIEDMFPKPGVTPPEGGTTATFRINGQQVQDYARVQTHIDALEGSLAEISLQNRQNFVKGLAEGKKIAATQIDSLTALALTMTPEQFSAFQAGYKDAPAIFQQFGQQNDTNLPGGQQQQGPGGGGQVEPSDLDTAKEIVANHRRAGMPEEMVQKSASFKKLVKAGVETVDSN